MTETNLQSTDKVESDYPIAPITFNHIKLDDQFWLPRLKVQRKETIPFALKKTRPAVDNLRLTGAFLRGEDAPKPFSHRFVSSDLYKVMEGAAYSLALDRDAELEAEMDQLIQIIGQAQKDDGYLYVAHICGIPHPSEMGETPYSWVVHSHELYNMGHMYEGAVAYFEATGKGEWLKIAEKSAQHINKVFFEGDVSYNDGTPVNQAPGHQEIELALCRLYRVTGNRLYLEMARKFLEIRGRTYRPEGEDVMSPTYAQQHKPVKEQSQAVGHAVRAAYMYAGMADVTALSADQTYVKALDRIWQNIVNTRMHITGGLGAIHGIEGFGPEYQLPNEEAYNETCAAIANVFFNHRMTLLHRDAKYFDVAEVALFNNSLAGVNLNGNRFFYVNPLESDGIKTFNHGRMGRSPWFDCACCPSNIARVVNHVGEYMYAVSEEEVFMLLYASSQVQIPINGNQVEFKQITDYPYHGKVTVEISVSESQSFTLNMRIPTWAQGNQFLPGNLYTFNDRQRSNWQVKVNGEFVYSDLEKGFISIQRKWESGDLLELELDMQVRFNTCSEKVQANNGRSAVTRGPLVYCAEGIDNGGPVQRFSLLPATEKSEIQVKNFTGGPLRGIPKIRMDSVQEDNDQTRELTLIPYHAWNNRGNHSMIVWIRDN